MTQVETNRFFALPEELICHVFHFVPGKQLVEWRHSLEGGELTEMVDLYFSKTPERRRISRIAWNVLETKISQFPWFSRVLVDVRRTYLQDSQHFFKTNHEVRDEPVWKSFLMLVAQDPRVFIENVRITQKPDTGRHAIEAMKCLPLKQQQPQKVFWDRWFSTALLDCLCHLEEVHLHGQDSTGNEICGLSGVKRLFLTNLQSVTHIHDLLDVQVLDLQSMSNVVCICKLPSIKEFRVCLLGGDPIIAELGEDLQVTNIQWCNNFSNQFSAVLHTKKEIQIGHLGQLDLSIFKHIPKMKIECPNLIWMSNARSISTTSLDLCGTYSQAPFYYFPVFDRLEEIYLRNYGFSFDLQMLAKTQKIHLKRCDDLSNLSAMRNVRELRLDCCRSVNDLSELACCLHLKKLSVVTNQQVCGLEALRHVRDLSLVANNDLRCNNCDCRFTFSPNIVFEKTEELQVEFGSPLLWKADLGEFYGDGYGDDDDDHDDGYNDFIEDRYVFLDKECVQNRFPRLQRLTIFVPYPEATAISIMNSLNSFDSFSKTLSVQVHTNFCKTKKHLRFVPAANHNSKYTWVTVFLKTNADSSQKQFEEEFW